MALTLVGSVTDARLDDNRQILVPAGNFAYVTALAGDRLTILDISDPANPTIAGSVQDAALNGADGLAKSGDIIYVAGSGGSSLNFGQVAAVDVSDPANPTVVGSIGPGVDPYRGINSVAMHGADFVVVAGRDWMFILDATDPANMSLVAGSELRILGSTDTGVGGQLLIGDTAFFRGSGTSHLVSVDISDHANPTVLHELEDTTVFSIIYRLRTDGTYIYSSAAAFDGLGITDVSDPANMVVVGSVADATLMNEARGLAIRTGEAFISTTTERLSRLDVSTPTAPTREETVNDATHLNGSHGCEVRGDHVYVCASAVDEVSIWESPAPGPGWSIGHMHMP